VNSFQNISVLLKSQERHSFLVFKFRGCFLGLCPAASWDDSPVSSANLPIRSEKSYPRLVSPAKRTKPVALRQLPDAAEQDTAKTQEGVSSASLIWDQNIQLLSQGDLSDPLVRKVVYEINQGVAYRSGLGRHSSDDARGCICSRERRRRSRIWRGRWSRIRWWSRRSWPLWCGSRCLTTDHSASFSPRPTALKY
jgi:hypothetical protein